MNQADAVADGILQVVVAGGAVIGGYAAIRLAHSILSDWWDAWARELKSMKRFLAEQRAEKGK